VLQRKEVGGLVRRYLCDAAGTAGPSDGLDAVRNYLGFNTADGKSVSERW